ncbi:MAG: hypothetical protein H7X80_07135 [bacterium]|nr:hypothetical protein [Candidatus Kapabacteria bacterium]
MSDIKRVIQMNHYRLASFLFLLIAAAVTVSSCSDASLVDPPAPQWGVGGELVFDSYSVDTSNGFWRTAPDSTVRYKLTDDDAAIHGRTGVSVLVSSTDSILIGRMANGDAEFFLNRFAIALLPIPKLWTPLPFITQRDATFMDFDTSLAIGSYNLVIAGNALAHYAGTEEYSAPGITRLSTVRTEIVATAHATAAVLKVGSLDMDGTVWFVPATNIIARSDIKLEVSNLLTGADADKSGTSLRLKEIVYPK